MNKVIESYSRGFGAGKLKICYQSNNFVLLSPVGDMGELMEDIQPVKDTINELYINSYCNYKIEGKDLAIIRNKLLCFPEFQLLSANTLVADMLFYKGENIFMVSSNSFKLFYLPEVKITGYYE
ncbi:hypothetical protein [Brachyspira aalborgi]|uniref:hypothetical protein n=1 Tax=Brachyspira aalborgi TaxID=29522 RepID=UPI0011C89B03|nr:hypothetical protein [Brachyspira aalborgi]TXJ48648.1 hypothetical protein EPJ75_04525 [Brachyspira aalborgi]